MPSTSANAGAKTASVRAPGARPRASSCGQSGTIGNDPAHPFTSTGLKRPSGDTNLRSDAFWLAPVRVATRCTPISSTDADSKNVQQLRCSQDVCGHTAPSWQGRPAARLPLHPSRLMARHWHRAFPRHQTVSPVHPSPGRCRAPRHPIDRGSRRAPWTHDKGLSRRP